jgi:CBS domain-containing protein
VLGLPALLGLTYSVPRAIGHHWPEPLIRAAAPWLERASTLAGPLVPTGPRPAPPTRPGVETVGEEEIVVLAGVLTFTERIVREVMTRRTDIVALDEATVALDAAVLFRESGHSRLPVYRESLDHITGMAYVFDLLKVGPSGSRSGRCWPCLPPGAARTCCSTCSGAPQLAVVLDGFGGTAGMVTLEDLLEELVGRFRTRRMRPSGVGSRSRSARGGRSGAWGDRHGSA